MVGTPELRDLPPPPPPKRSFDVAIIGAGVIGNALAVALARQGRDVLLLERDLSEPNRIVGELLQPGGVRALEQLGIADCLDGFDAVPCHGYQVRYHDQPVHIPYAMEANGQRPQGRSFHHGRFIQKLRATAKATPNVTIVEATVSKNLIKNAASGHIIGVRCTPRGSKHEICYFASLTVAADGCKSNLRSEFITRTPDVKSHFFGLELIDAKMPLKHHGIVILSDRAPVLVYQIGTHETRALVDIRGKPPSQTDGSLKSYMLSTVLPTLPEELRPSFKKAVDDSKSIRSMPNQWLPPSVNDTPGLMLLGDSMNMRHPLTGGGMTVAFNDVVLVRDLLADVDDLADTEMVLDKMAEFHYRRRCLTSVVNILAQALYALFAADDPNLKILQRGCFAYFQRGGICIDHPVGLLSGVLRKPLVLYGHFFAVAFYSIWIMFRTSSPLLWPVCFLRSFAVFYTACVVILPYIWSEL
ncbi:Squalene epoxidase [Orbilia brochopaga]|uniref:Squalene monooxygenase n=1 Tax=Orbilia brochopaga TaxID=3140254 RepID=A0AAV9U5X3_9PEZI